MNADDVIPLPGTDPVMYARRAVVDAWTAAGSPTPNSATRLYDEQRELRDGFEQGLPGYSPADDPDDPSQPLAHVRGVALDITPTPERVAALEAAGLVRPYDYEEWHWQLPGDVRRFPLITTYPTTNPTTEPQEDTDMHAIRQAGVPDSGIIIQPGVPPFALAEQVFVTQASTYGLTIRDLPDWRYNTAVREAWTAFGVAQQYAKGMTQEDVDRIANATRDRLAAAR